MKGIFALVVTVLAATLSFTVEKYNSQLGEILGMAMVQPFVLLFIALLLYIIYKAVLFIFYKEEKAKIIEAITEAINVDIKDNPKESNDADDYNDIYLTKSVCGDDLIEYQVINKRNEILWRAKCNFNQGEPQSIMLYSGDSNTEIVLHVAKANTDSDYRINDSRSTIGRIKFTNMGLIFNNLDNKTVYAATLETIHDEGWGAVADFIVSMDTLNVSSSASKIDFFVLKGENDEIFGKYYGAIKNLDLTNDANNKFDRRIATIFSILLDNALFGNGLVAVEEG